MHDEKYRTSHGRARKTETGRLLGKPVPKLTEKAARRFWSKVEKTDSCWLWMASTTPRGYGQFSIHPRENFAAHRVAYSECHGPIPPDMVIDHLCRVRHCVNPDHLEVVTAAENSARGAAARALATHCLRGHELTPETTYTYNGYRSCKACIKYRAEMRKAA